ncbi:TetR/AcrR family transcriptional regulator [Microbacterium istanbulense]|uniref:TetR family transcriptional regulator C-terminal domain-containing protein n=1 Tax=Microbacterium istanbulense TaxID=3122049 RepID=A0ABU8LHW9_9MICO
MPRVVDHDERRRAIAGALLAVAAREGHESVTSRAVAAEAGMATGALWHYFAGFDDVVRAAAAEVTRRTDARIRSAVEGRAGLDKVRAAMGEVLPLTDETRTEAAVVVGFWGRLAAHAQTPDAGAPTLSLWQDVLREGLSEAVDSGELRADTPQEDLLALLRSITYGQQIAHVTAPESAAQHVRVLESILSPWRTPTS